MTTPINGNVTFEPGANFQADDLVPAGTLNGTGVLTFQPGSYITLSGTTAGTINALVGAALE